MLLLRLVSADMRDVYLAKTPPQILKFGATMDRTLPKRAKLLEGRLPEKPLGTSFCAIVDAPGSRQARAEQTPECVEKHHADTPL